MELQSQSLRRLRPSRDPYPSHGPRDYNIAAVDRTLDLLEALSRLGPASLAALAESAGCTRTAAFRLLRTLQGRGFTIQDEARGLWRLGARWSALGRAASEQGALAATAMPFLATLGKATGENVYLRIRDGMESETIAIYQTDPAMRMYTEVGKRGPLHAGSSRMLLAFAPEAVQTQVLAQRLNRFTPATRIDSDLDRRRPAAHPRTRLSGHRRRGGAGAVGIAAPVRDAAGPVVAVLPCQCAVHADAPAAAAQPAAAGAGRGGEAVTGTGRGYQANTDRAGAGDATPARWPLNGGMLTHPGRIRFFGEMTEATTPP